MFDESLSAEMADILLERPRVLTIGGERFFLYPMTLGKSHLTAPLLRQLPVNGELMRLNPYAEALRLVKADRAIICRLMALHTLNDPQQMFDGECIATRAAKFAAGASDQDLAKLFLLTLNEGAIDRITAESGLDKEAVERRRLMDGKMRHSQSTRTFGGRTAWGSIIDHLCERYGWTLQYCLWDISLANIRMLMADTPTSIYLTDEEMKEARIPTGLTLDGNDPETLNILKTLDLA